MSVALKFIFVLATIFLFTSTSALAGNGKAQVRKIGNGVYSFTLGQGNFSMFIVGERGVAVIESFHSDHARQLLAAIRDLINKPIKYLFHSHNHWDHSSGGQVFKNAGVQTVMHRRAAEWLAAHPGRDAVAADVVWSGDRRDIDMGNFTVQMHHMGVSHGLGMTVFTIPERRTAYIADLVTPNRVMFAVVPDFNIGQWERSLGEILQLDFDIAVCSHNALPTDKALNGCSQQHVTEERQYIRDLRSAITAEFRKGTGFMNIPKAVKLPQYAHGVGYDAWLEMNVLRLMTDLWMGPFPWIPPTK